MCGRYTLISSEQELIEAFELAEGTGLPALPPRFNVAPTQDVPVIRVVKQGEGRGLHLMRWGLIPSWAKDASIGSRMINSRAETAAEKPSFRTALRRRRCLIPCSGFYEWQAVAGKGGESDKGGKSGKAGQQKQPYYIRRRDGALMALAGLWERWCSPDGEEIESCTILTTEANELIRPLHDRMPVILRVEDFSLWLDPLMQDVRQLEPLLRPTPSEELTAYPVGRQVGNPRIDDSSCIEPISY